MKGWLVSEGDYCGAVSAPTASRARWLLFAQYDSPYGGDFRDCMEYRAWRRPALDGRPEGVLEDLHSMRLAGVCADESELGLYCQHIDRQFWEYCERDPVCCECCRCAVHGCECEA